MTEIKKDRRLRILWNSNAVWANSGYSVQSRDLLFRFLADEWKMAMVAFYGLEGGEITINGLKCYPKMGDPWGMDACIYHQNDYKADCVFTFQNIWVCDPNLLFKIKNWIAYVPVEFDPLEPPNKQRLEKAYRIVTLSKFGHRKVQEAGLQSTLILEATDTDIFKPMDKMEIRKLLGVPPDVFLFGMVAANKDNPPRKAFQQVMDAFARFVKVHPEARLYFHVILQQDGGFPIQEYAQVLGISNKIFFTPAYDLLFKSPHPVISKIVNTFDVLLSPSSGEGFGLPIVEAQACGVPVVVNDWTSMPELVVPGVTGEICEHDTPKWTNLRSYSAEPKLDSLYEKMEAIFKYAREQKTKDACRKFVVENYDMNTRVKETWIPFLEKIQLELLGPPKAEEGK